MNILIGDIGGTKTILSVVSQISGPQEFIYEKRFSSKAYSSFESLIAEYISTIDITITKACFAVAGPIQNNEAKVTNLPWIINSTKLEKGFGFSSVSLINDLEAIAVAVPFLSEPDIVRIHLGQPDKSGNIAVIAPGTGLGEAFLIYSNGGYSAHPSEGSHASFSPINELQSALLHYFFKKGYEHISVERVCSGSLGIPNIYTFLKETGKEEEPKWLSAKLAVCDDPTPIIIGVALNNTEQCSICQTTLDLFCEILAVESGNLALKILSTGGIYLAGGIPIKIIEKLKQPKFINIFQSKGRFKDVLSKMPVNVVVNQNAGLIGAAICGLKFEE